MSSILKAIRKIEDEKRSGDNKSPDLMVDHGQSSNNNKFASLLLLLSGVLLGGVVVGFMAWGMLGDNEHGLANQNQPRLVKRPDRAPNENKANRSTSTVVDNAATKGPSIEQRVVISDKRNASQIKTEVVAKVPVQSQVSKIENSSVKKTTIAAKALKPGNDVLATLPAGITLAVSEIYYSDQGPDSMAVVNDLPVMVGTYVGSAIVAEIGKDHVVFKLSESLYKVPLTQP
jgi:hypothetical protein